MANRNCVATLALFLLCGFALSPTMTVMAQSSGLPAVDFSRDIRPLLSDTCFKCHGPDSISREADLRLDSRESVFDDHELVVPGKPLESELYLRLIADDEDMLMPPAESGRKLTEEQIGQVREWIEQGAEWGPHWSLAPPVKPGLPKVVHQDWIKNDIDAFVLRRIEAHSLVPSDAADRKTLARRLALDLTGLPPDPELAAGFLADPSEAAYEAYVDALIASPRYGEHMARYWLDVARYGDTHGLHLDNYREHWPYRDWIISAFNNNMGYDRFSTEQLAGDLLANPTREQLIATGFNRSHVTTAEGGSIKDEVRVRNVVDRTSTFGTVFLGLTIGCAQCHDHKFDPVSQEEFYSLYAYFNSLDGDPMDGNVKDHPPNLMVGTDEQMARLKDLNLRIKDIDSRIKQTVAEWKYVEPDDPPAVNPEPSEEIWIDDALPSADTVYGPWQTVTKEQPVHQGSVSYVHTAAGRQQYFVQNVKQPWQVNDKDELFVYVYLDPDNPPREIMLQWNDGSWEHRAIWGEDLIDWGSKNTGSRSWQGRLPELGKWVRLSVPVAEVDLLPGAMINGVALTQYDGTVFWDSVGKLSYLPPYPANRSFRDWILDQKKTPDSRLTAPLKDLVSKEQTDWNEKETRLLLDFFVQYVYPDSRAVIQPLESELATVTKQRDELKASIPTTLIYKETSEPKPAFLLKRGQYDQPGEPVSRSVPAALPAVIPDNLQDKPANDRLALANWLFRDDHPLTARVAVNRFWQQIFGYGLVESSEDFGAQGTFPDDPDLLDYLAVDFRENDWDMKRLMKKMVMSATYRQSSAASTQTLASDPENRLLARGRRYRLDAEVLRDQALSVSGLLVEKIGGPSVKPPQPDGLWFVVGYSGSNTVRFRKDEGPDKVHRRSMYTFWKRTAPAPQMNILDAPSRETCIVRRERTNTPLQALMLMNDPQYVEAARHLAQRTITEGGADTESRIRWMFRTCLLRDPSTAELDVVKSSWERWNRDYRSQIDAAKALIAIGEEPAAESWDPIDLASWTMVSNLIMNMDEFLTRN